jgi:hypothetical protein
LKRLKFINKTKDKNIGFSKNEINVLVQELNIQNDVFLNYLENAGKKSNILNTNFVDVNEYIRLQKEFRNLIDNDSEINFKSSSVCYFNFNIDHFRNKYFYFIKTNDKLTNPNIFYYSKGEIPIGVNFRDERTEKIGIVDLKTNFIEHINYKTELKFGKKLGEKIISLVWAIFTFPIWLPIMIYLEIRKRFKKTTANS